MLGGVRSESTPTFFDRFEDAFLHEAVAFVQAVTARMTGGAPALGAGATLADALEATRIGKALREACASGRAVDLVSAALKSNLHRALNPQAHGKVQSRWKFTRKSTRAGSTVRCRFCGQRRRSPT